MDKKSVIFNEGQKEKREKQSLDGKKTNVKEIVFRKRKSKKTFKSQINYKKQIANI